MGVNPIFTWPVQKGSPRGPILDKKEGGVKFKENIIISSEMMYRSKIMGGLQNMQNIFKKNAMMRGTNCRVTNMLLLSYLTHLLHRPDNCHHNSLSW
jgi:hypothetical protein